MEQAGSHRPGDAAMRVFLSHTTEFRDYPRERSYVAEAEQAISAAGHVSVDMDNFPAAAQPAAEFCAERVRGCDVYLGLLGTRYGTPVRDRPEVSYTELEFEAATRAGLDRLVFMLDTSSEAVNIPPVKLIDHEFGERQDAFRQRVRESGLLTQSFADPSSLGRLVERSLRELARTHLQLSTGIRREQRPAEPRQGVVSRFVNPPPAVAPSWFQGRQAETALLARYVADPGIAMVTVAGRGGIGKTALVCRLLKGLEAGHNPDTDGNADKVTMGGILYLSSNGMHKADYPTLVAGLLRLLPQDDARRLERRYQDPHHMPREMMLALLEAVGDEAPIVVLLDNLESVMDTERESLSERAFEEALHTVLTAPAHPVTVIATTQVRPTVLLTVQPARQRRILLEEGLGSPDAEAVLRALDDDGHLGLRDADDELLGALRRYTRGVPRALEAIKAILDGDDTLTPEVLLDRTRRLPEDRVVQVLIGEAFGALDVPAQQVMQALSVFPAPVSVTGIDFLLQPVNPTVDAQTILTRLVRRQLVRFQDARYAVHPLDREFARAQLPPDRPDDDPARCFTLVGLRRRAADYYAKIRTPKTSWRTLEDLQPQLAEFELRCDTGDFDGAEAVLQEVDFEYLQTWGHYRTLLGLHQRIHGRLTDLALNAVHLRNLGICHDRLGDYRQAIDLFTQALTIHREIGGRLGEAHDLANLGVCDFRLGDYRQAVDLTNQALEIHRDVGGRLDEAHDLANLGICHDRLGEYRLAIDLLTEALSIHRDLEHRLGEAHDLANMGLSHHNLGSVRQAKDLLSQALAISRDVSDSYGEALALGYLGRAWLASGDAPRAMTLFEQAVGIAVATGEIEPVAEASASWAQALLQVDELEAALDTATVRPDLPYPTGEPSMRLLEGLASLGLNCVDRGIRAFEDALTAAEALLGLTDRNVRALQIRALALSGLAVARDNPAQAGEVATAFARVRAVTSAAGVAADTRRLLGLVASYDRSAVLAEVYADHGV